MSGATNQNGDGSTARKQDVPLAIIGISCLFPGADGLDAYWHNIKNGVDSITDLPQTHWSPDDYFNADPKTPDKTYASRGGFLPEVDFNPLDFGIAPNALEATDTAQLLGIYTARKALIDAGYGEDRDFDRDRVSVLLGVTGTSELTVSLGSRLGHPFWRKALKDSGVTGELAEDVVRRISDSYVEWQEASFPGLLGNVVAGRIANRLDLGGTNCVVDAACASSLSAIHLAAMELADGRCDMAVTGGVDTLNDIFMYMCFSKTPALSPSGDARPFDHQGDGTILGEGVGILILKRLDDATRDGDKVYAEIRGLGTSSDGKGNAIYAPSSDGQAKALRRTYERAGAAPDTVELVEAHGTGTVVGDAAESAALSAVYREKRADGTWCALGSVKSQIGHTKAAAGAASLIKAAMALHHKVLPPTLKVEKPLDQVAPGTSPFYVNTDKRPWITPLVHPRRAAVSSFGFGGSNFHCLLQEHVAEDSAKNASPLDSVDWDGEVQLLAFSGSRDEINGWLQRVAESSDWTEVRGIGQESRAAFRSDATERLLVVIEKGDDISAVASRALAQLASHTESSWSTPDGLFYGRGSADGALAFLYPGQGSQYVGMLRDLACQFPALRSSLDRANGDASARLSDVIYPHPAFDNETRTKQEETLRDTRRAQPAIGATSVGADQILRQFGVTPTAAAGHSFGELTALRAAGRLSDEDFHALARLRGKLMGDQDGGRGAMLAVRANLADVEKLISEASLDLVVANRNAPEQIVLSGTIAEITRAEQACQARRVNARRLPVSAAFHSPLVAQAAAPLAEALRSVKLKDGSVPVYANTTATQYPSDSDEAKALLAGQLERPVLFDDLVQKMHRDGVRTFVEVGPHARLSGLVASILKGQPHHSFALDASHGSRSGIRDLARALAQVGSLGHTVDLQPWDASFSAEPTESSKRRPVVSYRVGGANIRTRKRESMQRHELKAVATAASPIADPVTPVAAANPPPSEELAPNGHAPNGHTPNGHTPNGHVPNGHAANGHGSNGHAPNGHVSNGHAPGAAQVVAATVPHSVAASVAEALRITQENMVALQRLQAQTAQLHHQFLEGQNASQAHYHTLLQQQQRFLDLSLGLPVSASTPVRAPAPTAPAPLAPPPVAYAPPPVAQAPVAPPVAPVPVAPTPIETQPVIHSPAPAVVAPTPVAAPAPVAAAPVAAAPVASAAAVEPAVDQGEDVAAILLDIVAEKTGYPADVLDLKMELDADLGIDSIKRVEILSALQDALPGAPKVGADQLGTLRTLQSLLDLMPGKSSAPASSVEKPLSGAESVTNTTHAAEGAVEPEAAIRGPLQRYVLRSRRSGVSGQAATRPSSGAPIWVTDGDPELATEISRVLTGQGLAARVVGSELNGHASEPVAGVIVLPPREGATGKDLLSVLQVVQAAGKSLRAVGRAGGAFLITASRLDGAFGTSVGSAAESIVDPMTGGFAGISKSASHEWPEVRCRAFDLAADLSAPDAAAAIVAEMFVDGPSEVGLDAAGSHALALHADPIEAEDAGLPIQTGDVVVLSGGARGVTAEAALALAAACQPTLILLGRSAEPEAEPAWLEPHRTEGEIKKAVLARGEASTPREAGALCRKIRAEREIRSNLARMRATGATVRYVAADVTDASAVRDALRTVREELGPIRALVHGAGVLADQHILDKTAESFRRVYEPKVSGLLNLLDGLDREALRAMVVFSSTTARYGRAGQVDYAIANEVLNKIAQQEARCLPECRVVSLNWGPWEGGMVDESLRTVFASEGVPLIPLRQGAEHMLRELAIAEPGVERIILGPAVEGIQPVEHVGPGDLATEADQDASPNRAALSREALSPREALLASSLPLAVEETLSVATAPFLRSHVLDGKAVVPMAMLPEWLAHAAMHGNPGLKFHGVDKLRVLKGVVLDPAESLVLKLHAGSATKDPEGYRVPVELRSVRSDGTQQLHTRADILLVDRLPSAKPKLEDPQGDEWPKDAEQTYRDHLFHGEGFQGIERLSLCSPEGVIADSAAAPSPKEWMERPLRRRWLTDPLALDVGIQLLTFWTGVESAGPSLPCAAARYRQYRAFPKKGVRVVARITQSDATRVFADIEFTNAAGQLVARFEGCENTIDAGLVRTFRSNRLLAEVSS